VGGDISGCACVEGYRLGRFEPLPAAVLASGFDRSIPSTRIFGIPLRVACLSQRDRMDRSQTHLPGPAVERKTKDPRPRPGGAHLEVKPTAIVVHPLPADASYLDCGEPVQSASHV